MILVIMHTLKSPWVMGKNKMNVLHKVELQLRRYLSGLINWIYACTLTELV